MRKLLAATLVLVSGAARADDFSGRARLGYNQVRSLELDAETFAQIYDLRFERPVSTLILYRLALAAQDDLGTALVAGQQRRHERREVRPVVSLHWGRPELSLQLGYDLTWSQTLTEGVDSPARLLQHATAAALAEPSDHVHLAADVQARSERAGEAVDAREVRGGGTAAWKGRTLTITGSVTTSAYDDSVREFSRVGLGFLGGGSWADTFDAGRVNVTAATTAQWTVQKEESRAGMTVLQPRREQPVAVLHAIDDTPLDSRDHPLEAIPALLDANLATATAVDLGPRGADHQALAVDLGRFLALDELLVHVRSLDGNTVPRGGDILFQVYTSIDGRDWVLHEGNPDIAFVAASSVYQIVFPPVTARFVKAVSFGVNSLETRVTEVEVQSHTPFTPLEDRTTQTLLDSVQIGFTYNPHWRLTLAYTALLNLTRMEPDRGSSLTSYDAAQAFSVIGRPARWLEAEARVENRRAFQSGGLDSGWSLLSGMLTATPSSSLTATTRVSRGLAAEAGGTSTTDEARLQTYLRFLPSLDSTVEAGYGRQAWASPVDRQIDRTFVSWLGNAQLLRSLRVTGNVAAQRAKAKGGGDQDPLAGKDYRAYGEASWRASQQLLLAARLGWAEGDYGSGWLQRYRVDWRPLPGGALVLGLSFDEDIQNSTGYRSRRLSLFPSWTINRHASLNLNYTQVELSGPDGTRRDQLFFLLLTLNS